MENDQKKYYTIKELAQILGYSRITIFNRIKKGEIKAQLIGKTYIIPRENIVDIIKDQLSDKMKSEIEKGVSKVLKEYGDVLKKLAKE